MKIFRNLVLVFFVGILILISGCTGGDDRQSGFPGIGGGSSSSSSGGVSLEFAENNPPSQMFKGQPVNFAFVFKNHQRHEVSDLRVRLRGFDTSYTTSLQSEYSVQSLPRATTEAGPGIFAGLVVQGVTVDGFTGNYNFDPIFDWCYTATTTYREQICVPSEMNQCNTRVDRSMSQNGPISVKIDYINNVGNKVRIDFVLSNTGGGRVVNECFNIDDYAIDFSNLRVSLGTVQGSCDSASGFKIIGNRANFYCEFDRQGSDSYASQVTVEFDYKYQQTTQRKILVRDLNER